MMKALRNILVIVCAMVALAAGAQQPDAPAPQPAAAEASTVNFDSGENQAISDVQQAGQQATPPAPYAGENPTPAPPPGEKPHDSGPSAVLLVLVLLLAVVAVVAIVVAVMARRDAARATEQAQQAVSALTAAVKQRFALCDDALQAHDVQLQRLQAALQPRTQAKQQPKAAKAAPAPQPQQAPQVAEQVVYLAPPDASGRFGSASSTFESGNSVFVLTSTDGGHTGTFAVIDDSSVHRLALMMPTENLTRACTGQGIQVSHGAQRVVTDRPGEAAMRDGSWQVTRQALIHYE